MVSAGNVAVSPAYTVTVVLPAPTVAVDANALVLFCRPTVAANCAWSPTRLPVPHALLSRNVVCRRVLT